MQQSVFGAVGRMLGRSACVVLDANHYEWLSNEREVLREMRSFFSILQLQSPD
jgi:hypothetical protein